ncbi:MAG TPA: methyltransferase domain-containing protein [Methanospirillum sp.]|nr:methyltransferase domain-containing protein [Methanospirillum sp.]
MSLRADLSGVIPEELIPLLPDGFEVIGDIAVISVPHELDRYTGDIAQQIIRKRRSIRIVLRKISGREGEHRVARYESIVGERTATMYHESGFSYQVDLAVAFTTSRLAGERMRIAALISLGEVVVVPFAGVGPFVIPVAARGGTVVAIELNRDACLMGSENARRNRVSDRVAYIRGDALTTWHMVNQSFDRAIIPTPYGLETAFEAISQVVRPGGIIHYYTFCNRTQAIDLTEQFTSQGYEVLRCHTCGNVAPSVSRWVFDLRR